MSNAYYGHPQQNSYTTTGTWGGAFGQVNQIPTYGTNLQQQQSQQEFNRIVQEMMNKYSSTGQTYGTAIIKQYVVEPEPEALPVQFKDSDLEYYIHKHD